MPHISLTNHRVLYHGHKEPITCINAACYAQFYDRLHTTVEIETFYFHNQIEKEAKPLGTSLPLSLPEITAYCGYLQEAGFKFEYFETMKVNGKDAVGIKIITAEQTKIATKVLLNAFRYAFEGIFPDIVRVFLVLAARRNKFVPMFFRLILAHYCIGKTINSGHAFMSTGRYIKFQTDEDLKKLLFENKEHNGMACNLWPTGNETGGGFYGGPPSISKEYQNFSSLKDLIAKYKSYS